MRCFLKPVPSFYGKGYCLFISASRTFNCGRPSHFRDLYFMEVNTHRNKIKNDNYVINDQEFTLLTILTTLAFIRFLGDSASVLSPRQDPCCRELRLSVAYHS